jgi:deoxycytidylate deaminase
MLNRCITLASKLNHKKERVASIICDKKGRIISKGVNSFSKSHPTQAYYAEKVGMVHRIFLHSEISALVNCKEQGHTIFVARVNRKGEPLPSSPCPICKMAILDAGIKEIITT